MAEADEGVLEDEFDKLGGVRELGADCLHHCQVLLDDGVVNPEAGGIIWCGRRCGILLIIFPGCSLSWRAWLWVLVRKL